MLTGHSKSFPERVPMPPGSSPVDLLREKRTAHNATCCIEPPKSRVCDINKKNKSSGKELYFNENQVTCYLQADS